MSKNIYDENFYRSQMQESYDSAKEVISYMRGGEGLFTDIESIIDVGCGVGTWLKAWADAKPNLKYFGIDGNGVEESLFYIAKDYYKQVDLTADANDIFRNVMQNIPESDKKPFDLAESLEVAEHLEKQYAENFIKLLTMFSDIVLFSAAIPHQEGTEHINEQPPKYWADLFAKFDYVCFDILRKKIWNNEKIGFWYRQNLLLFVHKSKTHLFEEKGFRAEEPLYIARAEYVEYYFKCWQDKCKENPIRIYWRHPTQFFRHLCAFIRCKDI